MIGITLLGITVLGITLLSVTVLDMAVLNVTILILTIAGITIVWQNISTRRRILIARQMRHRAVCPIVVWIGSIRWRGT